MGGVEIRGWILNLTQRGVKMKMKMKLMRKCWSSVMLRDKPRSKIWWTVELWLKCNTING